LKIQISRIPDERFRANLRETMGQLFKFLEADVEQKGWPRHVP
jgi:hypothetical protein